MSDNQVIQARAVIKPLAPSGVMLPSFFTIPLVCVQYFKIVPTLSDFPKTGMFIIDRLFHEEQGSNQCAGALIPITSIV